MAKLIQNNFSGGEISPCLYGRSDLATYYKGCADAENFVIAKEGTLRKRRGVTTRMVVDASYKGIKLVPYKYDRSEGGFLLVWTTGTNIYARLYRKDCVAKGSQVTVYRGKNLTAADVEGIQSKQIGDQLWLTNGVFSKVVTVTNNATIATSAWAQAARPESPTLSCTGRTSSGGLVSEQEGGETTYYYCAVVVKDGVMSTRTKNSAVQKKTWQAGSYTSCTVGISAATRDSMDYVLLGKSTSGGGSFGELTRFYPEDFNTGTSYTYYDYNISPGDGIYTQTNVLGDGFTNPLCIDCFQQRRVFANATTGGKAYPMTLWMSEVGNLENFYASRPSSDSDAFSPTIAATGPAFIRYILAYQEMMVLFTDCGLFSVSCSSTQGFSASSCRISKFSDIAVAPTIAPVVAECGIVFVGADLKTVYSAAYDLQENMIKPINRSVLVEHLTRTSTIKAVGLQASPDNVVWVVTEDGKCATFTFEKNEEVYAWSHSVIEGAKFLDVISPGTCTDSSIGRTYGDLVFVVEADGVKYLATPNEGYADEIGGVKRNVKAVLTTLRPESQERTIQDQEKNVHDVLLKVYETGGLSVKPTAGGADVPLVEAKMASGEDGLFTGDVKVMPRGFINEAGQMTYVSDNDKACEILQVVTKLEVRG